MKFDRKLLKDLVWGFNLAFNIIFSFGLGIVLGQFIDKRYNLQPIFTLIFIFIAFIYVMKMLIGASK